MMSETRFAAVLGGMSEAAKKVYAAVPISETWHLTKIIGELNRQGSQLNYNVISGCLTALQQAKLIRESSGREFRREPIRPAPAPKPKEVEEKTMNTKLASKPPEPATNNATTMDKIGNLAARVSGMAAGLQTLADDLADLAVEVQADLEVNQKAVQQLADLKMMFKTLGIAG